MLKNLALFFALSLTTFNLYSETVSERLVCDWTNSCLQSTYLKISSGPNFLTQSLSYSNSSYKIGYLVSGAIGYKISDAFSCEIEYAYRHNLPKERFNLSAPKSIFKYSASSYMANIFYHLPVNLCGATPYVGLGSGIANQTYTNISVPTPYRYYRYFGDYSKLSTTKLAWQVMTGISFPILNQTFSTEYRIFNAEFNKRQLSQSVLFSLTVNLDSLGL